MGIRDILSHIFPLLEVSSQRVTVACYEIESMHTQEDQEDEKGVHAIGRVHSLEIRKITKFSIPNSQFFIKAPFMIRWTVHQLRRCCG